MNRLPTLTAAIRDMFPAAPLRLPTSKMLCEGNWARAYMRNTSIIVDARRYHAMVLANVEFAPRKRGKGYFRELCIFVEEFAKAHPFVQVVQLECVLNPEIAEQLPNHGYQGVAQADGLPWSHFYKWAKPQPLPMGPEYDSIRCPLG